LSHLDPLAIWFLFIFGIFVPHISFKSGRRIRAGAPIPPRRRVFKNILVMQILFLLISLYAIEGLNFLCQEHLVSGPWF